MSGARVIVVDASDGRPLAGASVFDSKGRLLGISGNNGVFAGVSSLEYPIVIRYMGYGEEKVKSAEGEIVAMTVIPSALPEVVVEKPRMKMLHVLGYMREYSTLATMTDTVFLFREKMVDFMLNSGNSRKFKGWRIPRVLKSESYYRFTDANGLDSVSNKCASHFSWSDWIGMTPTPSMPDPIRYVGSGTDTVYGKYSPAVIWTRGDSKVNVNVDVLAAPECRRWVPELNGFFKDEVDFEKLRLNLHYNNVIEDEISVRDLTGYNFIIESNGRGRDVFTLNRRNEKYFVTTYAEVYIVDREFITVDEARKWQEMTIDQESMAIMEPPEAPDLQPEILQLMARVEGINHDDVRLDFEADVRLGSMRPPVVEHLGKRALNVLKQVVGISQYKGRRNFENNWQEFLRQRKQRFLLSPPPEPLHRPNYAAEEGGAEGGEVEPGGDGEGEIPPAQGLADQ